MTIWDMYTIMKNWREIPLCEEYGAKIRHVVLHKNGAKYLYIYNYLSADTKLVEGTLCHSGEHIYHGVQSVLLQPHTHVSAFLARNIDHMFLSFGAKL